MRSDLEIAGLIRSHFPSHFEDYGPGLVDFIQEYFRWLESTDILRLEFTSKNHGFSINDSLNEVNAVYEPFPVIAVDNSFVDVFSTTSSYSSVVRIDSEVDQIGTISRGNEFTTLVGVGTSFRTTFGSIPSSNRYIKVDGYLYRVRSVISDEIITTYADVHNITSEPYQTVTGSIPVSVISSKKNDNVLKKGRQYLKNIDIDKSLDLFVEELSKTYLHNIPTASAVDRKFLLKHVLDLYRSKGTDRGMKLLFRLFYDKQIDIYYPIHDTFTTSDSEYIIPKYIEVTDSAALATIEGHTIVGSVSGAKASADRIATVYVLGKKVNLIYISNLVGDFQYGESIVYPNDNTSIINFDPPVVIGSLNGVIVSNGGDGFKIGDEVIISGSGTGARGIVRSIRDDVGTVRFSIGSGGFGYTVDAAVSVIGGGGTGATFQVGSISNTSVLQFFSDVIQPYLATPLDNDTNTFTYELSSVVGTFPVGNTVTSGGSDATAIITASNATHISVGSLRGIANTLAPAYIPVGASFTLGSNSATVNSVTRLTDWAFPSTIVPIENLDTHIEDVLTITNITVGTISSLVNVDGGQDYTSNPTVSVVEPIILSLLTPDGLGNFWGNNAVITPSVTSADGVALAIEITQSGYGFDPNQGVTFTSVDGTKSGTGSALLFGAGKEPGYWRGTADLTSNRSHLQDSRYYQAFSYEIRAGLSFESYESTVRNVVHPRGMAMFGRFALKDSLINNTTDASMTISQE